MRYLWIAALSSIFISTAAYSDVTEIASTTGSERLTYFATTLDMKTVGDLTAVNNFVSASANIGFNALDTTKSLHGARVSSLRLYPTLNYDDNANGGNKSDKIVLGNGLTLSFPEQSLAQQDGMVGLEISSGARIFYGRGRYLDFSAGLGKSWALSSSLSQLDWNASVCSRNYLAGWSFLDFCGSHSGKKKALSGSDDNRAEVIFTHIAAFDGLPWELRAKAFRQDASGDWNFGGGFQALGVINSTITGDLSLEAELPSVSRKFERYATYVGAQFKVAGHVLHWRAGQSLMSNSRILGELHNDTTNSLVVGFPVGRFGVLSLSIEKTRSRIKFYDAASFSVSLDVSGVHWKDLLN